ncbi:MAG TPA: DUF6165 family protein [Novosphingobium sp.]|nr:DUF6165 family protein [Novosphingobium sp.]
MSATACPEVPVSWGELIDKITILQIKQARLHEAEARRNVARELFLLHRIAADVMETGALKALIRQLRMVNEALWQVEDALREREAAGDFGRDFILLARSVYRQNDRRAALKRRINLKLGSLLVEEKSYSGNAANRSGGGGRAPDRLATGAGVRGRRQARMAE